MDTDPWQEQARSAIEMALAVYWQPSIHGDLLCGKGALPANVIDIIEAAHDAARQPDGDRNEPHQAALFFVQRVLLSKQSDHYRVLGLTPDSDLKAMRRHYRLLMAIFHPDHSSWVIDDRESCAARINLAYRTLRNPDRRSRYEQELAQQRSQFLFENIRAAAPIVYSQLTADSAMPSRSAISLFMRRHLPEVVLGHAAILGLAFVVITYLNRPEPGAIGLSALSGARHAPIEQQTESPLDPTDIMAIARAAESEPMTERLANAQAKERALPISPRSTAPAAALPVERLQNPAPAKTAATAPPTVAKNSEHAPLTARTPVADTPQPARVQNPAPAKTAATTPPAITKNSENAPAAAKATIADTPQPARIQNPAPARTAATDLPVVANISEKAPAPARATIAPPIQDPPATTPPAVTKMTEKASTEVSTRNPVAAAAKPMQPVQKEAPSPAQDDMTRNEAEQALQRFAGVYRGGDLKTFMSVFAKQARSNSGGFNVIRADYNDLFRATTERLFELDRVRWTFAGRKATAKGRFAVRVRERGSTQPLRYSGSLRVELIKTPEGKVLIEGLFHRLE